ncbi:MAG TPA: fumarylacetoacetate hydrolase family protein, partial [Aquabacterium sp.]|nr:fumarylacetoacetate hydrolase family protein [Aquabacterium sp.]
LRKGDLILTGTPGGIALQVSRFKQAVGQFLPRARAIQMAWRAQQRSARFLHPGDTVTMQATGLGSLNLIVEATP